LERKLIGFKENFLEEEHVEMYILD